MDQCPIFSREHRQSCGDAPVSGLLIVFVSIRTCRIGFTAFSLFRCGTDLPKPPPAFPAAGVIENRSQGNLVNPRCRACLAPPTAAAEPNVRQGIRRCIFGPSAIAQDAKRQAIDTVLESSDQLRERGLVATLAPPE